MIVCSCNVFTDHDIRAAVSEAAPQTTGDVYRCLGCSPKCGRCVRTVRQILTEALGGCPSGCTCSGCGST